MERTKYLFEEVTGCTAFKANEELFIDYRLEPRPNRVEFPDWI